MPYTPPISDYKPLYIQTTGDATAWDTRDYGLVAQTQPFLGNREAKEPYKNDWKDDHGDDEYTAQMFLNAFEITVKFYIKAFPVTGQNAQAAIEVLNGLVDSFMTKVFPGEFMIWDSWQGRGFRGVRFVRCTEEKREIRDEYAWKILSFTFKVNDPVTAVSYANNAITPTA